MYFLAQILSNDSHRTFYHAKSPMPIENGQWLEILDKINFGWIQNRGLMNITQLAEGIAKRFCPYIRSVPFFGGIWFRLYD